MIKAIIFDIGGVISGSPLMAINDYEHVNKLPKNFININVIKHGKHGAFQKLERGELSIPDFIKQFKLELDDPISIDYYIEYMNEKKNSNLKRINFPASGYDIDTKDVFSRMMTKTKQISQEMLHCLFILRSLGYITVALTNNFTPMSDGYGDMQQNELHSYFDEVLESSVIGIRKPNPEIYKYTLNVINKIHKDNNEHYQRIIIPGNDLSKVIDFNQVAFLDDIGVNVKSAKALGINAIKVMMNGQKNAILELEKLLKLQKNTLMVKKEPMTVKFYVGTGIYEDEYQAGSKKDFIRGHLVSVFY